jgi:hypothetical protein
MRFSMEVRIEAPSSEQGDKPLEFEDSGTWSKGERPRDSQSGGLSERMMLYTSTGVGLEQNGVWGSFTHSMG